MDGSDGWTYLAVAVGRVKVGVDEQIAPLACRGTHTYSGIGSGDIP